MSIIKTEWQLFILVGVGGAIGASARYAISFLPITNGFPFATLITNLIGCFVLAYLLSNVSLKRLFPTNIITAIGSGVIGSFTTFSAFALETIILWNTNNLLAIIYVSSSIIGGIFLCFLGNLLAVKRVKV
ncbi:CrcB protein [Aquibacillus halophilus]|uniref:Fluoride-specific ion channel FluC n=1 Tax=Aquibacillus halophilus TaxID=930132 RepID=A0A6A8DJM6_9BACI|nr:CrcB family protein [Aquibacillus halophilus]MRH44686.1 CrcB protein [Aquibacillus halophilus]